MIFYKCSLKNLSQIMDLLRAYGNVAGQRINLHKSKFYVKSTMPLKRIEQTQLYLGFTRGSVPVRYLGVPIFKGKLKASFLLPIVDRIKSKLASWKGNLLSCMGRVLLVRSVLQSMLIHNFQIYKWLVSLLKLIETWFRNLIWTGTILHSNPNTVPWHKVCSDFEEGGLGLKSLSEINNAYMLILCWNFLKGESDWAVVLGYRVAKKNGTVAHYLTSTIWASIRDMYPKVKTHSTWIIGNGTKVNFWTDRWLSMPIVDIMNIHASFHPKFKCSVSNFLKDGSWHLPPSIQGRVGNQIDNIAIPFCELEDSLIWDLTPNGDMLFKDPYSFFRQPSLKSIGLKQFGIIISLPLSLLYFGDSSMGRPPLRIS
uniref:Ribonuclease H protein At1g65750 family n=1 Tax=Cajanus cajan TaxID=3821 RepID=A0A151RW93_CAJCA|nr:Putative ribonuclease H protein At1g65750 family [Cajanus cajan]